MPLLLLVEQSGTLCETVQYTCWARPSLTRPEVHMFV